jgi:hypothetical protein
MAAIAIVVPLLTLSACAEPPTPVIGELRAVPTTVAPGEAVALYIDDVTAVAPVTYTWRVQRGEILTGQGTSTIQYQAPDTPGTYAVTAIVSAGEFSREMSVSITVTPSILSTTLSVAPTLTPTPTLTLTPEPTPPPPPCTSTLTTSLFPYEPGCGDVGSSWGNVQYCQSAPGRFVASVDLHNLKPNGNYVFSFQAAEGDTEADTNSLLGQRCEGRTDSGDAYCDATLQPATAQGDVRYAFSIGLDPGKYVLKFLLKDVDNDYCVAMYNDAAQAVKVALPPPFQKGMSYVAWQSGAFSTDSADEALEELAATGANWIALVVTGYQETNSSTTTRYELQQTPADDDLVHVIGKARELGLNVMLKPHVDLSNDPGHWRGEIGRGFPESDWRAWFTSYTDFINHYVALAAQHQDVVKIFCVGTELVTASSRDGEWRQLLREVRAGFDGELVYASNWDEPARDWWAELDYIGVDAYFPLETATDTPSVEDLKVAWQPHVKELENLYQQYGRPLILTEIGYRSVQGAHANPAQWQQDAPFDQTEQEALYQAALETFWGKDWLAGIYWWNWLTDPNQGGPGDTDYTPHGKLAEAILIKHYGELVCEALAPYGKPGGCPIGQGEVCYPLSSSDYFRASVTLNGLAPNHVYAFTVNCKEGSASCKILAGVPGCQVFGGLGYCDIGLQPTDPTGMLEQDIQRELPAGDYDIKFFIKDPAAGWCILLNNDDPDPFTVR